jgi:3',5'-cyclic AMP phosphodiesterase CpdA
MVTRSRAAALATAALLLTAEVATGATLTRYPYLNRVTPDSVLIAWQTDVASPGRVVYAQTPGAWSEAADAATGPDHAVTLTGLLPGTVYVYGVVSGTDTLTAGDCFFRTAPAEPEPFRFAAFGDLGRATPEQREIAARIDTLGASLAIVTGDIIYEAGEATNFTPQFFDIYNGPSFRTLSHTPFYTSLGNHDVITANGQPYLDAFHLPDNSGTERYYSFDYGDAHFAALEITVENTAPSAAMLTWLDADLAATTKWWKFVFFHVPPYSNLGAHGDDATIAAALGPILTARGADVVFQGHNHFYERTYPISGGAGTVVSASQEPAYVNPGAPIYVTAGTAGRSLHALGAAPAYEVYANSTWHAVVVTVAGNTLLAEVFDRAGRVFDSFTLTKTVPSAVTLASFEALPDAEGVRLRWRAGTAGRHAGFNVYRSGAEGDRSARLNTGGLVTGGPDHTLLDRTAEPGVMYTYRLGAVDLDGREEIVGEARGARGPAPRFAIGRPAPSPFEGSTVLAFTLDRARRVRVTIADLQGRVVRVLEDASLDAGPHALRWDGRDDGGRPVASGIYFAIVNADGTVARTRIARLR